jgi:hypothetical protein
LNDHVSRLFVTGLLFGLLMADGECVLLGFPGPASAAAVPSNSDERSVSITTDKLRYQLGETIVVQVKNGLDTTITTRDQRFQCTIIALEHRRGSADEWTEVRNCYSGAPVSEVTLEPGTSTTIRLESGGAMPDPLEPGMYRAALDYALGDRLSLAPGHLLIARSEQFQIK